VLAVKRALLQLALTVALVASVRAQVVIADLRADYDARAGQEVSFSDGATSQDANILDTAGSGRWNFHSSWTLNPTNPESGLTLLTYTSESNSVRAANAFVSVGNSGFDLPGWSNTVLITPSSSEGAPSATQLAVHPGETGPPYAVASWTSGITGTVSLTGGFQDLGAIGDGLDFAIFVNGSNLVPQTFTDGNTLISFNETFPVVPGDIVYFMVGLGPGDSFGADQAALSAVIAIPEPATWTIWTAMCAAGAAIARRRLSVALR
jgi:hypothetical protein